MPGSENSNTDLKIRLAQLNASFTTSLPSRLLVLEEALSEIKSHSDAKHHKIQLEIILNVAHKLAGTAGTFGNQALSDQGKKLENLCDEFLSSGGNLDMVDIDEIAKDIAELSPLTLYSGTDNLAATEPDDEAVNKQANAHQPLVAIVDDDLILGETLASAIEERGFKARHCLTIESLSEFLVLSSPDILIMDIVFESDRNGGIRAIENLRSLMDITCPVIFMSVRDDMDAKVRAYRAGCSGYLTKPINIAELVTQVEFLSNPESQAPYRVLLIEDEPDIAEFYSLKMNAAGLDVHFITDPMLALNAAREHRPEVIISDIAMPGCDGFELAATLRFDAEFRSVPIVFLTASGGAEKEQMAMQAGGDNLFEKSQPPEHIVAAIAARARRYREYINLYAKSESREILYESAFTASAEGLVTINETGKIETFNPAAAGMFGYTPSEVIGRDVSLLLPEQDRGAHRRYLNNSELHAPRVINQARDLIGVKKSGGKFPIELNVSPMTIDRKKRYVGVIHDISERKLAEKQMKESEQIFRDFAAAAADRFWETDADHRFIEVSEPHGNLTTPSEAFLGKQPWDVGGAKITTPGSITLIKEAFESQGVFRDIRYTRSYEDGSQVYIRLSGVPVFDTSGKFTGYRGIFGDESAEMKAQEAVKLAQKKLLESENRLKNSQAFANIGTWDWEIQTGALYWSDRIAPLFGYEAGTLETTYDNFVTAIHPDDRKMVTDAVADCVENGAEYDIEHRTVWPDGTVRWLSEKGDVTRDEDGSAQHMLGVVQDITQRHEFEIEIHQAREEADRANQAKSEFLSSMSHELRTPMNAILGFGQMLEYNPKEPLTQAQKDCVTRILSGGQHLLNLINEILDLAQIEAGKVNLSLEEVDLGGIFEECLDLTRPIADKRDISVDSAAINDAIVIADHIRLKQVFLNLIGNAVKYNVTGGKVTVSVEPQGSNELRICVADTGPGIPAEKQGELFQPFSRLGAEATEVEGTGIGLTITKQLVELMNGEIGFDSVPGKGSTFWIVLPAGSKKIFMRPDADADEGNTKVTQNLLPEINGTVLYVEDNPANLELMKMIVKQIPGLDLLSTHNAEFGLELADRRAPDIIIMDIDLPGMNGFQALEKLKTLESCNHIPVVALSANAMPKDIKKGLKAGFVDYLTKPIDVERFVATMKQILDQSR
ncbi:MAG: response regulator [Rhodospirillales bacterium]|nr:response regulator [Rhodospirillales bacterium]